MLIQSQCSVLYPIRRKNPRRRCHLISRPAPLNISRLNGVVRTWLGSRRSFIGLDIPFPTVPCHIEDMLDYLHTTQYQMRGILAISLGRVSDQNPEKYTHAVCIHFQGKENIDKFYDNPFYLRVLKEQVLPYHELLNVHYQSEVENDIVPIFRKGEEFNVDVEFVLLLSFVDNASGHAEEALVSLEEPIFGFPSSIVQTTQGMNLNLSSKVYTHGVVIRFRSYMDV